MLKKYTIFTLAALSFLCIFVGQQTKAMEALDVLKAQFMQEQQQKLVDPVINEMFKELLAINPKMTAQGINLERYKEAITKILKKHDMYNTETVEYIHGQLGEPYQFAKEQGLEKYTEVMDFEKNIMGSIPRILKLEILRDIEEGK